MIFWNEGVYICFNSTMVRLKGERFRIAAADQAAFQFHNGSIKSLFLAFLSPQFTLFQFHNGSIKSEYVDMRQDLQHGFQFHNGSIKSDKQSDHLPIQH